MGIVNVSLDSFSGDGLSTVDAAVEQAKHMVEVGADIIDVGGESTRPNSQSISVEEELSRVIPVITRLSREMSIPISLDSYKYEVAQKAIAAGAHILNDIWALKQEPQLAGLAAKHNLPIILMSNQRDKPCTGDIMAEIISDLKRAIAVCRDVGVAQENIIVDPGIGFGKTLQQNLEIVHRLAELKVLSKPILLGTSRKSMIGLVLDLPINERVEGTAATVAIGISGGADIIRVHDVKEMLRVARMSDAITRRKSHE
jgi:dihydropteroate synthase